MNKKITFLAILFLICFATTPFILCAQSKVPTCANLKNGVFHYYPKNSADHDVNIRVGDLAQEISSKTSDTIVWETKWIDECTYTLKYRLGNLHTNDESLQLLKKHKLVYEIGRITKDYYLFTGYVDKVSNTPIQIDTMWLYEKGNKINNELFKPVASNSILKKAKFSDTSKYAVLYLYRPKKFSLSLSNYVVYFDNSLMCVAQNNTGFIFKILKEGTFEVKSKFLKDQSSVNLNIKFGKVYYIKSMVNWAITSRLYNFRLAMANMPEEKGSEEFNEVDLQ